jgi:hypothetical protein
VYCGTVSTALLELCVAIVGSGAGASSYQVGLLTTRTAASGAAPHPLRLLVCTAHPCCKATVGKQLRLCFPSQLSLQGSGRT